MRVYTVYAVMWHFCMWQLFNTNDFQTTPWTFRFNFRKKMEICRPCSSKFTFQIWISIWVNFLFILHSQILQHFKVIKNNLLDYRHNFSWESRCKSYLVKGREYIKSPWSVHKSHKWKFQHRNKKSTIHIPRFALIALQPWLSIAWVRIQFFICMQRIHSHRILSMRLDSIQSDGTELSLCISVFHLNSFLKWTCNYFLPLCPLSHHVSAFTAIFLMATFSHFL